MNMLIIEIKIENGVFVSASKGKTRYNIQNVSLFMCVIEERHVGLWTCNLFERTDTSSLMWLSLPF